MQGSRNAGTVTRRRKKTEIADAAPAPNGSHASSTRPEHEEIAKLAYQFWEERGRPEGSPYEDWFRARNVLLGATS